MALKRRDRQAQSQLRQPPTLGWGIAVVRLAVARPGGANRGRRADAESGGGQAGVARAHLDRSEPRRLRSAALIPSGPGTGDGPYRGPDIRSVTSRCLTTSLAPRRPTEPRTPPTEPSLTCYLRTRTSGPGRATSWLSRSAARWLSRTRSTISRQPSSSTA